MTKQKRRSYLERYAYKEITRNKVSQQAEELYLLSDSELLALKKIRIVTLSKAALVGALGIILLYVPYHLLGERFFPVTQVYIPYFDDVVSLEIEFLIYSVVLVVLEIWYLTMINIKAVSKIANVCGCPDYNDPNCEENINSLVAVGLEKKQKQLESIGINPFEGLSKFSVFIYQLVLKIKAALSGFLLKLTITKIFGRYILRMIVDLAGIPLYAFWNAWGARVIMNETRVRVMAPVLIKKFTDGLYTKFKDNAEFRSAIYATLQTIAEKKRAFHYNHFLLATTVLNRFDIAVNTKPNHDADFLTKIDKCETHVKKGIAKLLLFGIMIDGRLSYREKRILKKFRNNGLLPFSEEQVKRWTKDYFDGRGLEEFFAT